MWVRSATPSDTRRAHVRHPSCKQRRFRGEREPENGRSQSDAPMATDGDRHANDDDDECDQLNRTNDHEPDDNMSHDDDDDMVIAM